MCDELVEHLGVDLQGYRLDHIALASVGHTPIDAYDPRGLLDVEASRSCAGEPDYASSYFTVQP